MLGVIKIWGKVKLLVFWLLFIFFLQIMNKFEIKLEFRRRICNDHTLRRRLWSQTWQWNWQLHTDKSWLHSPQTKFSFQIWPKVPLGGKTSCFICGFTKNTKFVEKFDIFRCQKSVRFAPSPRPLKINSRGPLPVCLQRIFSQNPPKFYINLPHLHSKIYISTNHQRFWARNGYLMAKNSRDTETLSQLCKQISWAPMFPENRVKSLQKRKSDLASDLT